jgi:hypothetical protein
LWTAPVHTVWRGSIGVTHESECTKNHAEPGVRSHG